MRIYPLAILLMVLLPGCLVTVNSNPAGSNDGKAKGVLPFDPGPPRYPAGPALDAHRRVLEFHLREAEAAGGSLPLVRAALVQGDYHLASRGLYFEEVARLAAHFRPERRDLVATELENATGAILAEPLSHSRILAELAVADAALIWTSRTAEDEAMGYAAAAFRLARARAWLALGGPTIPSPAPECETRLAAAASALESPPGSDRYSGQAAAALQRVEAARTAVPAGFASARNEIHLDALASAELAHRLREPRPSLDNATFQDAWERALAAARSTPDVAEHLRRIEPWFLVFHDMHHEIPEKPAEADGLAAYLTAAVVQGSADFRARILDPDCPLPPFRALGTAS